MTKFKCINCGSEKLGYKKFVECITPLEQHNDGIMEYLPSAINEEEYLATQCGFICGSCGDFVKHCGITIQTERDLHTYNNMDPVLKAEQQAEYDEHIAAQEAQKQSGTETFVSW